MVSNPDLQKMESIVEWLKAVPYEVLRKGQLYNAEELYRGYEPSEDVEKDKASFADCYDSRVYRHFMEQGKIAKETNEMAARAIHDQGIHTALKAFFAEHDPKRCVGVMGGHAILRTDPMFATIVMMCKRLTEEGFLMVSGGGPGAMEATHLGAWMAGRTDEETQEVIRELAEKAPSFKDNGWVASALQVMHRYPQQKYVSLGIPTWLYGHEPSTPFATHIAKLFMNSVREDVILTVAYGGIIYTPGSAGTLQEIFQDAVQNHYLSLGFSSPMIFMGKKFWTDDVPVWPLIQHLVATGRYKNMLLTLSDDPAEIENVLLNFQKRIPQKIGG